MRLLAAALLSVLLLAACGDDDDPTSSPTEAPTVTEPAVEPGQLTPNPDACTADVLDGDIVSARHSGDATLITFEVTNTEVDCVFDGPPELRWYDADGAGLGVPHTPAAPCDSDATEYGDCVYADQISLPERGSSSPSGTVLAVRAIISVTDVDTLVPCASPTKQAQTVGLQFPGVSLDVQVELEEPIEMQYCSAQVDLVGYGPVEAGQN